MANILVDDWLYTDMEGQPGMYGREEFVRNLKSKVKSITAAFIDCETKVISAYDKTGFTNEYVVQEESLSGDNIQLIGAKDTKVEEIYRYFKPLPVDALVPYPVCLRAYLKSKSLLPTDQIVVFVDDLKSQAIVTILEGPRFTAPRRISMRDMGYMVSEIKRSQHNYLSQRVGVKESPSFMVISNNREWLMYFMEANLVDRDHAAHVDDGFPALEGLRIAKFGVNFIPFEELARKKKRAAFWKGLKVSLAVTLIVIVGGTVLAASMIFKNDLNQRLEQLQSQKQEVLQKLRSLNVQKFGSILNDRVEMDYGRLYYGFIQNVPADYQIKEFSISKLSVAQWVFEGWIYPSTDEVAQTDFYKGGIFTAAQLDRVIIDKRLGQKIKLIEGEYE